MNRSTYYLNDQLQSMNSLNSNDNKEGKNSGKYDPIISNASFNKTKTREKLKKEFQLNFKRENLGILVKHN